MLFFFFFLAFSNKAAFLKIVERNSSLIRLLEIKFIEQFKSLITIFFVNN